MAQKGDAASERWCKHMGVASSTKRQVHTNGAIVAPCLLHLARIFRRESRMHETHTSGAS
jgi:hypothetical protein